MKHAFTIIRVDDTDWFWLGELSADRKRVRCLRAWGGITTNPHWIPQKKQANEEIIPEGHPDYDWCCVQMALLALKGKSDAQI